MVRIDFFTKKDAEYSDYMRYIIANTLQEYEGEVTLNQIPENKATEEEISKYGIEVYPTIIVSGDNMDGFNKLEGMARKADLINGHVVIQTRNRLMTIRDKYFGWKDIFFDRFVHCCNEKSDQPQGSNIPLAKINFDNKTGYVEDGTINIAELLQYLWINNKGLWV